MTRINVMFLIRRNPMDIGCNRRLKTSIVLHRTHLKKETVRCRALSIPYCPYLELRLVSIFVGKLVSHELSVSWIKYSSAESGRI